MTAVIPLALCLILSSAPASPGPTLAREDTLSTEVSPVLVRAPRVTLDEILDRVSRGEARRDSMIHDQSVRVTLRVVRSSSGSAPELVQETVYQVYRKRPHRLRVIQLRERREHSRNSDGMRLGFGKDIDESIVNFAFQPGARREFSYSIVGRDLVGGHLLYRIAFRPRSTLDPGEPSGVVWIDTNDFVIIRQEVSFERSPVPLFLRGVDRMVIERRRAGDLWVLSRVLVRASLTIKFPRFGNRFDMALLYDDYTINAGLPDTLFALHAKTPGGAGP